MTRRFSTEMFSRDGFEGPAITPPTAGEPGPYEIFRPDGYEPNYAYPLVIWFHEAGGSERTLWKVMAQATDRNALGLAIRGERVLRRGGFDWLGGDRPRRRERLMAALRELRGEYHIHTERIVLAGEGSGGAAAAHVFNQDPSWYGGLALFDVRRQALPLPLAARKELSGKPVLLDMPTGEMGEAREMTGQLRSVGMEVRFQHDRQGPVQQSSYRSLDRWILEAVCGAAVYG